MSSDLKFNNLSLDDIRLFIIVYESKSYTISALITNTSQPTVSRRIKHLEDYFEQKLFYSKKNTLYHTDFADALYKSCHNELKNLDNLFNNLKSEEKRQEYSGTIRVQLPVIISKYLFSPHIPSFIRKYPNLNLQIIYSNSDYDLVKNKIDIAIMGREPPLNNNLKITPLSQKMYIRLFGTNEYVEKYGMPTSLEEMKDHLFLGYINEEMKVKEYFKAENKITGEHKILPMNSQIITNDGEHGLIMMLSNEIIVGMIDAVAQNIEKLYDRKLVTILPDWHAKFTDYYLIENRLKNQKNIELVSNFLIECFKDINSIKC
jgi:DNA-binding transcriptional LysR family regulator